jgi:hypothetical protein
LVYFLFYVPLKNVYTLYGDVTIAGEGLQNSGPFSREAVKFRPMLGSQGL